MKFYIGVTDSSWFSYLAYRQPDEVNFWPPGGRVVFRSLNPGEMFLFKLHAPLNFIVGGGFFVKHSILPLSLAWEAFGEKNGMEGLSAFREKILAYRGRDDRFELDPSIGCIILSQPFFLERDAWLPSPEDWSPASPREIDASSASRFQSANISRTNVCWMGSLYHTSATLPHNQRQE